MPKLQGRLMATGLGFPEGPVAMPDGSVLVVEIAAGRLIRVLPNGELQTVADLKKYRNRLDEIVALVDRGLKSGKTVEQLQQEKILAPYEDWNSGFLKADQFIATVARDLQQKK